MSSSSSSSPPSSSVASGFDVLLKGWFVEVNSQWPGVGHALEVEQMLEEVKSEYQHCYMFKSKSFGVVMILDGCIQLTERDEMSYHEMMAHIPLFSHPNPENVLVVGGGDGAIVREILKHSSVKSLTVCEIDKMVIDMSKKYFSQIRDAWNDPRCHIHIEDAAKFCAEEKNQNQFDVIIIDSSDPEGPAAVLYEEAFYKNVDKCLKDGGKVVHQNQQYWEHLHLVRKLLKQNSKIFAACEYATTQVPMMPLGLQGLLFSSKAGGPRGSKPSCRKPVRKIPADEYEKLRYYTPELHEAAFALPAFAEKELEKARKEANDEVDAEGGGKAAAKKRKSSTH